MGREIRRVLPNWEHPKRSKPNYRLGIMEESYQPMHDMEFEAAMKEWLDSLENWLETGFAKVRNDGDDVKYGKKPYKPEEPYRAFFEWHGSPPDPEYYRPSWKDDEATWFQVYETVSEGTPVTPPFQTQEELIDYLATNGDYWDQKRGDGAWSRKSAEQFVNRGHAMSMVAEVNATGVDIKMPRDGA